MTKINFIWEMRNGEIKQERLEVPEFLYKQEEGKKKACYSSDCFLKSRHFRTRKEAEQHTLKYTEYASPWPWVCKSLVMCEVGALVQMLPAGTGSCCCSSFWLHHMLRPNQFKFLFV